MTRLGRVATLVVAILALAAPHWAAGQPPPPAQPTPGIGQPPTGGPQPPGVPGQPPGIPGQPPVSGAQPEQPKEEEAPPAAEQPAFRDRLTVPERPIPVPADRLTPPSFLGPDLFNPPAPRGWITFTPSFTLSEEFIDNVSFAHSPRDWDFITSAIPGFTLSMQRPNYRLLAGYNVSGQLFARDTGASDVGRPQQLVVNGFYRFNPRTTLSVAEQFIFDRASQNVTSSAVSAGQQDAWRNTLSAGLDWRATQLTTLSLTGSHTLLRYGSGGGGLDSDTYRAAVGASHDFTPRLSGGLGAESAYFDIKGQPSAFTETPMLSASYALTRRLRASVSAGPSFFLQDGDTEVNAAATARLQYALRQGSTQVGYSRAVTAETIGATEVQTFYASADWTFSRRLRAAFTPRYTIVAANKVAGTSQLEVLAANLSATYQVAQFISLIASYTYRDQRGEHRTDDVYENRVFFGVQYAYPINFE